MIQNSLLPPTTLKAEVVGSSETTKNFHQTTRHYIPELEILQSFAIPYFHWYAQHKKITTYHG